MDLRLLLLVAAALGSVAARESLTPLVVLAERQSLPPAVEWSAATIADFAPRTIDELLATDPSFSLYRAQSAIFANPTTTGVSLRQTGATAASRSLVLLDGIPQNDPFGGWINWARYDPRTLASARIQPSAGSAAWGNLSAAGSIRLTRRAIEATRPGLAATAGSQGLLGGSGRLGAMREDGSLGLAIHAFHQETEGFQAVPRSQRGPVDTPLAARFSGADLRAEWRPHPGLRIEPSLSFYDESRSNGTPLTGNTTAAFDASVRATLEAGASLWQGLVYFQDRTFTSVFSSVGPDRAAESVALDQFDVPGRGIGGAVSWRHDFAAGPRLTLGSDFRLLEGATHEDAGGFRRRRAGGAQALVGLFATGEWQLGSATTVDASARLDHWSLSEGERVERALASGQLLRAEFPADRRAVEPSAAISITRDVGDEVAFTLAASSAFRLPTLNELHRPFRVRSDVTEANPGLDPERFFSLEAGLRWQATDALRVEATLFHHWIHDAIANVPVTDPGEIARIFGSLPAGGRGAQRQNVERAEVSGVQLAAIWEPDPRWTLRLDALGSRSRFIQSSAQPRLRDQAFPQAPAWRVLGALEFEPLLGCRGFLGAEYVAPRFDDLLGARRLPAHTVLRAGLSWQATESLTLRLRGENLLDEEILSGLAGNGLQSLGQPRVLWLACDWTW